MTTPGTMTLVELQKLVVESKGEWEHLEFKKTTGDKMPWVIELGAFLDLFVLVFLMGIAINHLKSYFPEGAGEDLTTLHDR